MRKRRGSCLCGLVRFAVEGEVQGVGQCHCSQCRKVSGTTGNAVLVVEKKRFEWIAGEHDSQRFSLPSGWSVSRCRSCGSPLPQSHDGERVWVTAGLMDDALETDIKWHIFCGSCADWDREASDSKAFDEWPA